jgi:hypothetical protein
MIHHSAKMAVSQRCSRKFRAAPAFPPRKAHPYCRCVQNPLYPYSRSCLYLVPDAEWEDRSAPGSDRRRVCAAGPADSDFLVIEFPRVFSLGRLSFEGTGFRYIKRAYVARISQQLEYDQVSTAVTLLTTRRRVRDVLLGPFREQSPLSGPPQQGGHLAREPATQVEQRSDHCRLTKRGSLTQGDFERH